MRINPPIRNPGIEYHMIIFPKTNNILRKIDDDISTMNPFGKRISREFMNAYAMLEKYSLVIKIHKHVTALAIK